MNTTTLSGYLVNDAKLITTSTQKLITKLRMANNRRVGKNDDGSDKVESLYINVDIWNKHVMLKKGDRIMIEGVLRQEEWENDDGEPRANYYISANQIYNLEKNYQRNDEV